MSAVKYKTMTELAQEMVDMAKESKLDSVDFVGDDFKVMVRIKKRRQK